jgi:hypothetical protein
MEDVGRCPELGSLLQGLLHPITKEYQYHNTRNGVEQQCSYFIHHCKRVEQLPLPDLHNVRAFFLAYVKAWKLRKEKTNSANQHIGHYKASIQNNYICTVLYMRSEIPGVLGYSILQNYDNIAIDFHSQFRNSALPAHLINPKTHSPPANICTKEIVWT